jgi:hypothetical protein
MIGAGLGSCPCEGDLGNYFGRCGGLTMSFTHSSVSSLHAPTRSAVGFGLERLPGRRLFPGGNVVGFTPTGPQAAPRSYVGGPVGSPASIHGVRRCPRPMDGARRERVGKARHWESSAGLGHDGNV